MQFVHPLKWKRFRHWLSAPFIYSVFVGLLIFDVVLELYHRVAFPLYGMSYVSRNSYIRIDRHRLPYLGIRQKINCMYCGYANGLIHYAQAIAGETERYWCGIKHKNDPGRLFYPLDHEKDFLPYSDKKAFDTYVTKAKKS